METCARGCSHGCAIGNGQLWCWGTLGAPGMTVSLPMQIGDGQITGGLGLGADLPCTMADCDVATPKPAAMPGHPDGVVAGDAFTCVLDGTSVSCWGDNRNGQLGTIAPGHAPRQVPGSFFAPFSGGPSGVCAVNDSMDMVCWGDVAGDAVQTPRFLALDRRVVLGR